MSKFESSRLNREFKAVKKRHSDLFGGKVLAGVSGGADSMCLLYLLYRNSIETVVVHCNYQLRGKSSDLDQKLVEDVCSMWQMECVSVRLDPKEGEGQNFQSWARDERYRIFREVKLEENAKIILTAHHQDDQLETIFQKILRGAGLASWKGMDLLERDLLRPLLQAPKSEIIRFVQEFNIPYRIDSSNEESSYARNFIRNNWFPELNRLFPGWKENLMMVQERSAEFEKMTDHLLRPMTSQGGERLRRDELLKIESALWPAIIHRFLEINGFGSNVSRGFLQQISLLADLQTGKSIQFSDTHHLFRDREYFLISETVEGEKPPETLIHEPLPEGGLKVKQLLISAEPWDHKIVERTLQLDYDQLVFPLILRRWKEGDQINPLGMKGSQLISDHLTNQKMPALEKKEANVLASFDGTLYAVIFPLVQSEFRPGTISEAVKCTADTKKTLIIRKI